MHILTRFILLSIILFGQLACTQIDSMDYNQEAYHIRQILHEIQNEEVDIQAEIMREIVKELQSKKTLDIYESVLLEELLRLLKEEETQKISSKI